MDVNSYLRSVYRKDNQIYKVVAVAVDPTIELRNLETGDTVHLVIGSLLYKEYEQLVPKEKNG